MARIFFVDKTNINGDFITILGQEHIHLTKVLRKGVGEQILTASQNYNYVCKIVKIEKKQTVCKIISKEKIVEDIPDVTLFQAVLKGEHMDFLIQKATELNVKKLVPFLSEFVVVKPDEKKLERYNRISQEACKQSGRKRVMEIQNILSFEGLKQELKNYDQIIFAYENSRVSAKETLKELNLGQKIALIVGSEGGFSEKEVKELEALNAKVVSLGKNILRGETAGLTLTSIVMFCLNQFK
ncbi:MAG: 16S rRNA (uracil(1498)-N(3))-methyltransferase [Clostridia bacterium]|nr:16S rRNA (uracil(1498)-N(3))-methyltransferase [Clostridia bacterium]